MQKNPCLTEFSLYLIEENWVQSESNTYWFLLVPIFSITNTKKERQSLKYEAGGDKKHLFFSTWPIARVFLGYLTLLSLLAISHTHQFTSC